MIKSISYNKIYFRIGFTNYIMKITLHENLMMEYGDKNNYGISHIFF